MERLKDCIEELLKFTLNSYIDETLGFDLGISKEFCSNLLKDELNDVVSSSSGADFDEDYSLQGVPLYPLYKRLALALHGSVISREFCRTYEKLAFMNEDSFLEQEEEEWSQLILKMGSELIDILKAAEFELHVQEPFVLLIKEGRSTVGDYNRIAPGAVILLNKCMMLQVQSVRHYNSFSEVLEAESLVTVLPGAKTVEEGVQIYRTFYAEDKERFNGVLAIRVSKLSTQPYVTLASILYFAICLSMGSAQNVVPWLSSSRNLEYTLLHELNCERSCMECIRFLQGLSYVGIQRLLGLAHTVGTVSNALPPPRSALLSSFVLPYRPHAKGSTLTHGARALAKHATRSSNRYWGIYDGSDSDKNRLAMDVVGHLISYCCWLNMHFVPPHGIVFEIRVANGYGARWSKDGTEFIGFLEPYMEDGHSKGWKH